MAHLSSRRAYRDLVDRLNRFPQGAPPSERLFRILAMLFSEREAELVAQLPIRPFTAERAARRWRMPISKARKVLDELASRAVLVDIRSEEGTSYVLPPPMAGFFEFSMMRVREDLDQELLAELLLRVSERRGGVHQGAVWRRRDPARTGVRLRAVTAHRRRAAGARLRAGKPGRGERRGHRCRPLLLPPQDGARGPRL